MKITIRQLKKLISEQINLLSEEEKGSAVAGDKTDVKIPKNIKEYRQLVDIKKVGQEHLVQMDKVLGNWAKENAQALYTVLTVTYEEGRKIELPFVFIQNMVTQNKGPGRVARDMVLNAEDAYQSAELAKQLLDVLPKKS
jgi:hypothetical protein